MRLRQTTEIITPNFDKKLSVMLFMEKFYLNKGYHKCSKNLIIRMFYKFYFSYLRKIITLIKNTKFIFKNPEKKPLLIYDCENSKFLEMLLSDINYAVFSVRIEKIKEIYISKKIIFSLITNFFRASLKQNYIISVIKIINPKIVITNVDNSEDFHITSKLLKKTNIRFIAIQHAHRGDTLWKNQEELKKIHIPEFFCFSNFDKKIHEERNCKIDRYSIVGSLRASLAINYVKSKNLKIDPETYDICLISEPQSITSGDFKHVTDIQEKVGKIAQYTFRLAKEKNLKIIFSGKLNDPLEETYYYNHFLKNYKFQISPQKSEEFSTYINIMKSKMVIGHVSTTPREAIALKKKVLVCNFTGHKDLLFPSNGICTMKNEVEYDDFKKRVLSIMSMPQTEYINNLSEDVNQIMNTKVKTTEVIREKLNRILN